jgi:DNA-binding MarR family transcriptional regulator
LKTTENKVLCDDVLVALRRIMRAIDLQSRKLVRSTGLTGPQLLILKELMQENNSTVTRLAERISLSQATVTDILKRLESRKLITRNRSKKDKRCVEVALTDLARELVEQAPPLLQEKFVERFTGLKTWEKSQLLASLGCIADMMDAKDIDASPVLSLAPILTISVSDEIKPVPPDIEIPEDIIA